MQTDPMRSDEIQRIIRKCAVELHPSGELRHLAQAMGVHYRSFRSWWTRGAVPRTKAEWLQARFPGIASVDRLVKPTGGRRP